ncbi:hypothetical protein C0J52_15920, partial [Blattella germanica]
GFLSWNSETSHVDLEKELQALTSQAPEGEEARNGERLIQYATENLVTEVLIHPQVNTLLQCVRNLLSSFTRHRHLIHAGYTFAGNGSWILQDGTFSLADFIDAFVEPEVQRVLKAYENCVTVDVHCSPEGDWATERIAKEPFARSCKVRVNPDDRLTAGGTPIGNFINYISPFIRPASLEQLLEPSDVVGNIRFSHPTLYVFPGGQGDAALFGINGFNMLVDGGFARKACFWDFARHLDRLDAVLMTRLNNGNINGMSAVLRRKKQAHVYPQIGHFFCNLQERRHATSPDGDKDRDSLLVDLLDEGQEIVFNLRHLQLRPHPCYRDGNHVEPVNLYHKVGHGKLDMYIISPAKDSRDVKEFLSKWNANDPKLFGRKDGVSLKDFHFPLQNLVSICALLVWQPANPNDTITRILFPGSTPQHKIFEGLDKLKHLEYLKFPVCTARSISPSASTVGITSRASSKQRSAPAVIDKLLPGEGVKAPSRPSETNKQIAKTATIPVAGNLPDVKQTKPATAAVPTSAPISLPPKALSQTRQKVDKLTSKTEPPKMKTETNKSLESEKVSAKSEKATKAPVTESIKSKAESKTKAEPRTSITKSRTDTKPPRSSERKSQKPSTEKKSDSAKSSPTTPKKSVEGKMNGVASKAETAKLSRTSSRSRPSPTATPAKSTKEANNRKVVESKYQHVSRVSSTSRASTARATRKEQQEAATSGTKTERKPISRRPKPASPSKASTAGKSPGSPAKSSSAKSTPTPSVKSDKDGVIRKVKGEADKIATDSSAVSTPSTVEPETAALRAKVTEVETTETSAEVLPGKEEDLLEKESEGKSTKPDLEETIEKTEVSTDEAVVEEKTQEEKIPDSEVQSEGEKLAPEAKTIEESPSVETEIEKETIDEAEVEDKGLDVAGEETTGEKLVVEKEDVEATEEEKTEDIEEDEEEEEPEEQPTEIKKSLADELAFESQQGLKIEGDEDEEDEYLIIEKEEVEQYMEDSLQEQESVESHVPEEPDKKVDVQEEEDEEEDEGELQKHLRDEVESEKEKKQEIEEEYVKVNGFLEEDKELDTREEVKHDREVASAPPEEEDKKKFEAKLMEEDKKQEKLEPKHEVAKEEEEEEKEEAAVSKEITAETKEQLQEEVQEIITSAEEIVKTKRESETKFEELGESNILEGQKDITDLEKKDMEEGDEVKEASSISPEEKLDISSEKNREITDDTRDTDQKLDEEGAEVKATDQRYPAEESQPDERFSTTVESAATTAPTLPEDERIPLDEIKEIVEEKYVKEETKEEKPIVTTTTIIPPRLEQPTTLPQVVVAAGSGMFDPMAPHAIVHLQRDIVKTPDEVADLPVHEEVDPGMYESDEFSRDFKTKDDSGKKQLLQQEQEEEVDIKGDSQVKYDYSADKQVQESKAVQEKTQLPAVSKEEPKETAETELDKKTEIKEADTDKDSGAKIEDKTDKVEETLETKEIIDVKDTQISKETKDIESKDLPITEEKILDSASTTKDIVDEGKNIETSQIVTKELSETLKPDTVEKEIEEEKLEVSKPADELNEKTDFVEEAKQDIKEEREEITDMKDKGTDDLSDKVDNLEKEKIVSVKAESDEKLDEKDIKAEELLLEQTETDKESVEKKDETKEITDSLEKPLIEKPMEVESSDVSELKLLPESSKDEDKVVEKDIKQITEQFIQKESQSEEPEPVPVQKLDAKFSELEDASKPESKIVEKDDTLLEKTDQEKPIPEKQSIEPSTEISETEKHELEVMELKKEGKETASSDEKGEPSEAPKSPKEAIGAEKDYADVLLLKGDVLRTVDGISLEETRKLEDEKVDEGKLHLEDKMISDETEVDKQYEDDKLEKEEKESEKMDKEKMSEEEISKEKEETELEGHLQTQAITDNAMISQEDDKGKSSEDIHDIKPSTFETKSTDLGISELDAAGAEEMDKSKLKESTKGYEEKDIDEKDKPDEADTIEVSKDSKVDIKSTDLPLHEAPQEAEKLDIEEKIEEKPSPGALSMTYLEIIDKLQKDSQKPDDRVEPEEEKPPPDDVKAESTKINLKEDVSLEQSASGFTPIPSQDLVCKDSKTEKEEESAKDVAGKDIGEFSDSRHDESGKLTDDQDLESSVKSKDVLEEKSTDEKMKELPVVTDSKLADSEKSDTKEILEDEKSDTMVSKEHDLHLAGLQAELKLEEDKDDSYGDESLSPGEAYVDSGLEEEPVYGKLEAPEIPEYVTVTPDSAPPSPKVQRDQVTSHQTHESTQDKSDEKAPKLDESVTDLPGVSSKEEKAITDSLEGDKLALDKGIESSALPTKDKEELPGSDKPQELTGKSAIAEIEIKLSTHEEKTSTDSKTDGSKLGTEDESSIDKVVKPESTALPSKETEDLPVSDKTTFSDEQKVEQIDNLNTKITSLSEKETIHSEQVKDEDLSKVQAQTSNEISLEGTLKQDKEEEVSGDEDKEIIFKKVVEVTHPSEIVTEVITSAKEEHSSKLSEDETEVQGSVKEYDKVSPSHITKKDGKEDDLSSFTEHVSDRESETLLTKETADDKSSIDIHEKEQKLEEKKSESTTIVEKDTEQTSAIVTEKEVSDISTEEITSLKSTEIKIESITVEQTQAGHEPVTLTEVKKSETDISDTILSETEDSKISERVTSTITTEKTVVSSSHETVLASSDMKESMVDTSKAATEVSSELTSASTSTEMTSAKAIAEKESSAIMTSTIATVSAAEKEKDSTESGDSGSVTVRRMVVTASSEDGGTETELCSTGSITFTSSTAATSDTELKEKQEHPGTSSDPAVHTSISSSEEKTTEIDIKQEKEKSSKESVSKEDISKIVITSALGATNGDLHIDGVEYDESGSEGELEGSKQVTSKTTTTTISKKVIEMDDEIESDDRESYGEVTTQEIGEDGRIVTKTVKTTRTFVTVEGEESEDSDFEDEDNIESTAAEDGSDSSRISKTTTSFTTVTKPDDNGVRSLSTDSSDKTGDADSEIMTKTTTTTVTTVTKSITGEDSDEILTTTTRKEVTRDGETVIESTSSSHVVEKDTALLITREEDLKPESTSSSIAGDVSKESSPAKSAVKETVDSKPESRSSSIAADASKESSPAKSAVKETDLFVIGGAVDSKPEPRSSSIAADASKESSPAKSAVKETDLFVIDGAVDSKPESRSSSIAADASKESSPAKSAVKETDLVIKGEDDSKPESRSSSIAPDASKESSPAKSAAKETGEADSKQELTGSTVAAELSKESSPSKSATDMSKESSPSKLATSHTTQEVSVDGTLKMELNETDKDIKSVIHEGQKLEEKQLTNGKDYDKELKSEGASELTGKSVLGDFVETSPVSPISIRKEARSVTPGSDAMSDRDLDIGCGPSTPHSDISSGQVSRAATNIWGSHEGRPDSRHCDSDEDDEDDPGSPLSVTSQLAHSPPSHFEFEMSDRNTSDFDTKHSISTSVKHKHETSQQPQYTSSAMTSSFYGSLPPDPLQELLMEQKEKASHISTSYSDEPESKNGGHVLSKESAMTSSFYGSLGEKEEKHTPEPVGAERYVGQMQEDESLDFETALYEHRAARGKDLASSASPYHYDSTSSSTHMSKYEQLYTPGQNGQKQKDEHSYQDFPEHFADDNISKPKPLEASFNGKPKTGFVDPLGSGFHTESSGKDSEQLLKDQKTKSEGTAGIGLERDPMFHHQFGAPTTSDTSFPDPPKGFTQPATGKTDDKKKDPIADWGEPLGLPAPAPPPTNNSEEVLPPSTNKGTPKKEKKVMQMKKTMMMNENNKTASSGQTGKDSKSKRPESPIKQPSSERKSNSNKEGNRNMGKALGNPIYIDLTYVPHHGNSYYTTLEFFKKVRARYYVFSGTEPSREVYNALLDAKQTWEDKELEVTIIPTYDTDTLGYWVAENEDTLAKYKIDLSPSASRCTINLQDHETSCSAYRLEF